MEENIFKAYDIRGLAGTEITEKNAYSIGRAIAQHTGAQEIAVGHDMRDTSPNYEKALIDGLTDQGANVVRIGLCSTPLFYFVTRNFDAGVMVTASHNPKEYNGFKICRKHAIPIGQGSGMEEIKSLTLANEFTDSEKKGIVRDEEWLDTYLGFCLTYLKCNRKLTVVVDAGNGMGGHIYEAIAKKMPENITLVPMYWELDGSFPNHEANPHKPENVVDIQKKVVETRADLGLALDGDADRSFFIDEKGGIIPAPISGALITARLLDEKKKSEPNKEHKVVYDVSANKILAETIKTHGGIPVECRVGHAFIKNKMRQEDIFFGVENSGHMFHGDIDYVENELIPLFRLLTIMGESEKSISELLKPFYKYHKIPETNFRLETREKGIAKIKELEDHYKDAAESISHIDGVKVRFKDWWFLLRLSNTEPLIRLNLEADSEELMQDKLKEVQACITS